MFTLNLFFIYLFATFDIVTDPSISNADNNFIANNDFIKRENKFLYNLLQELTPILDFNLSISDEENLKEDFIKYFMSTLNEYEEKPEAGEENSSKIKYTTIVEKVFMERKIDEINKNEDFILYKNSFLKEIGGYYRILQEYKQYLGKMNTKNFPKMEIDSISVEQKTDQNDDSERNEEEIEKNEDLIEIESNASFNEEKPPGNSKSNVEKDLNDENAIEKKATDCSVRMKFHGDLNNKVRQSVRNEHIIEIESPDCLNNDNSCEDSEILSVYSLQNQEGIDYFKCILERHEKNIIRIKYFCSNYLPIDKDLMKICDDYILYTTIFKEYIQKKNNRKKFINSETPQFIEMESLKCSTLVKNLYEQLLLCEKTIKNILPQIKMIKISWFIFQKILFNEIYTPLQFKKEINYYLLDPDQYLYDFLSMNCLHTDLIQNLKVNEEKYDFKYSIGDSHEKLLSYITSFPYTTSQILKEVFTIYDENKSYLQKFNNEFINNTSVSFSFLKAYISTFLFTLYFDTLIGVYMNICISYYFNHEAPSIETTDKLHILANYFYQYSQILKHPHLKYYFIEKKLKKNQSDFKKFIVSHDLQHSDTNQLYMDFKKYLLCFEKLINTVVLTDLI